MVLAVEADGDRYHRAASARDRDRLRQETLERLGWTFCRVWASAWFADPEGETERIVTAWRKAVVDHDEMYNESAPNAQAETPPPDEVWMSPPARDRGPRPFLPAGSKIDDFTDEHLISLMYWLMRDGRQEDRADRIDQAIRELGFRRRGRRIVERLSHATEIAQHLTDEE
jgi:hypothetical protein